jgi:hypothetical protein
MEGSHYDLESELKHAEVAQNQESAMRIDALDVAQLEGDIVEAESTDVMEAPSWQWPDLDYGQPPERVLVVKKQFAQSGKTGAAAKYPLGNFLKGVKW